MGMKGVLYPCLHDAAKGEYSRSMPAVEFEGEGAVRRELERVLESPGFARNERISGFLRFVVERHLAGRDHELKESFWAQEVFGRSPD